MTEAWLGDACSLVDALRASTITPREAVDACFDAIGSSRLNAFSFLEPDGARRAAESADVSLPFGGLPIGVKELDRVAGWPETEASLLHKDRVADTTSTMVERLLAAGAIPVGLTTASEFGFINLTRTKLNGATRNPWHLERTPGGSSGGSAAAVAGGLVPIATGGDGGGSIRIPAGYSGLLGLKATFGRIPRGPVTPIGFLNVALGCLARSVRDAARWFDVCNGYEMRDPFSLPRVEGWEAGLGTIGAGGLRAAIMPDLQTTRVHSEVAAIVVDAAEALVRDAGLRRVDATFDPPKRFELWGLGGLPSLAADLRGSWPERASDLTDEVAFGASFIEHYRIEHAMAAERFRVEMNEAVAHLFEQADVVLCSTNPYEAFPAEGPHPPDIEGVTVGPFETGALTIPGNISGIPAVSIPAGTTRSGLPVGLQVYARHHQEQLLLDLALTAERARPWPLVAPGAPV